MKIQNNPHRTSDIINTLSPLCLFTTSKFEYPTGDSNQGFAYASLGLQKDSEFLGIFNHYLLKEMEHGITRRLFRKYHLRMFVNEQFGMNETPPLGYENVIFTFACLALGVGASMVIAVLEAFVQIFKQRNRVGVKKYQYHQETLSQVPPPHVCERRV